MNSKPKIAYRTDVYYALDLPVAPAVKVEEETAVEGKYVDQKEFEAVIRPRPYSGRISAKSPVSRAS